MYELSTTHRAAALTWNQRDILLDLCEREYATPVMLAARFDRSLESMKQSIGFLLDRMYLDFFVDHDGEFGQKEHPVYFLTEEGIAAIKSLEKE